MDSIRHRGDALLVLLPLALSAIVWFRLTGNYFYQDDFLLLYRIVNGDWLEFLLTPHGGHILITRNAVFALFHALFGIDAGAYFAAVLLTHLFNVLLLFAVIRRTSGSAALACFGAALWGTCRLNEGALGWYSVYGQVLVGTGLLLMLDALTRIADGATPPARAWMGWILLLGVTATCFGVGLAVAIIAPLLAWLLLPASPARRRTARTLWLIALAIPFLYLGCQRLYGSLYGGPSYVPQLVNAAQHVREVLSFVCALLLSGLSGLCLGAFAPQRPSNFPTALFVAAPFSIALGLALWRYAPAARARLVAYLLAAVACYGSVALGRALLVLPFTHAAAADEPRYHYAALIPLTLLVCELLRGAVVRLSALQWPILIGAALATPWLGYDHRGPLYSGEAAREEVTALERRVAARAAAQPGDGPVCIRNNSFNSVGPGLLRARAEFPGWAAAYAITAPRSEIGGRRVIFVEPDAAVVAAAAPGRRSAALLIPPDRAVELGCPARRGRADAR